MDFSFSEEQEAVRDLAHQILEGQVTQDRLKVNVPDGLLAGRVLVPAATGEGTVGVFLVDPNGAGVTRQRQDTTSGRPEARLELDGARVGDDDVLGDPNGGAAIVEWIVERAE